MRVGNHARVGGIGFGALVVTIAALGLLAPAAWAYTRNDYFQYSEELGEELPLEFTESNEGATTELEEPADPGGAGHTVWFFWRAPAAHARYVLSTCESDFPTRLDVYQAPMYSPISELAPAAVAEGPGHLGQECEYELQPSDHTEYYLRVDGAARDRETGESLVGEGNVTLQIAPVRPPNDDFATAQELNFEPVLPEGESPEYKAEEKGSDYGATTEPGEPMDATETNYPSERETTISGGASVWYRFTPPADWNPAGLSPNAEIMSFDGFTAFALYTGHSLADLKPVEVNQEDGSANAYEESHFWYYDLVPGVSYWLQGYAPFRPDDGALRESPFELFVRLNSSLGYEEVNMTEATKAFVLEHLPSAPVQSTPASTPPQTFIEGRSVNSDASVAVFKFGAESAVGFRCRLDSASWKACRSPKTYRNLTSGQHTFRVAAISAGGASDASPAIVHFRVAESPHRRSARPK